MHARGDDLAVAGQRRVARLRRQQFRDTALPLGRMFGVTRMRVVVAASRVRIDVQKALVLALERGKHLEQYDVFVDIGEVAGVILMAVFHGNPAGREPRLYTVARRSEFMTGHKRGLLTVCIAGLAALPACAAQP